MTNSEILVTKRNGQKEPIDLNKIHKVVGFACEGVTGVSASQLEINSRIKFYNGIATADIQETLIKAAAELITEETPNYQIVAARLVNYHLRKQIWGSMEPPTLLKQIQDVVERGFYDSELLKWYTEEEINQLNEYIKHDRDFDLVYAGIEQFRGKYLVRNRVTKQIFETPQFAYMLIAMCLFHAEKPEDRLQWVKSYYDAISTFKISLPTPIMAGVRTPQRQFSSCVLIESADDLDSIASTGHAIIKYVANKAGIGIGAGQLRPLGAPIRGGDATHTGVIPFFKFWQDAVKSCSQGGVRGGSATLYYPIFHYEVEDLLVLKNNKGTEFNRLRQLDYGVQFNRLFYKRLVEGGNITLLNPHDVPGLYDAFFTDQDKFEELYEKAERNTRLRKKVIPALQLFSAFMQERKDTGRIYLMNVDNVNKQGSFDPTKAPVRMSNLCVEITLPTEPVYNIYDAEARSEIALCILSALNVGILKPEEYEEVAHLAVRALDNLIDFQTYLMPAAEKPARARRTIGIGVVNFAYWMAKNDIKYQNPGREGLNKIHQLAETFAYFITKASVDLAKERGACEWVDDTKYAQGLFPKDTYAKALDEIVDNTLIHDWDMLLGDMVLYGIRNSTLMAGMPAETSALVLNATNGFEAPRALVSIKQSKDGVLAQVVPEIRKLKNKYDPLWEQRSPRGYLSCMAVWQKFFDQAISVNTSYNPKFYPENELSMAELLKDMLFHYKMGGKTLYYFNTNDGAGELEIDAKPAEAPDEEDCDSCKI